MAFWEVVIDTDLHVDTGVDVGGAVKGIKNYRILALQALL